MTISLESIPRFTADEARGAAERDYGIAGDASALPSERDQNFLIADAAGNKFVLKIANLHDAPALLDFQNQALRRVAGAPCNCRVQQVLPTLSGRDITMVHDTRTGAAHSMRVLTWIEGEVLANSRPRDRLPDRALFESIGECMAGIDATLRGFAHAAMHRVLQWDLRHAGLARENTALLSRERRGCVQRAFARWEEIDWTTLRHSVIHGDANDHNVIIEAGRMVGLLDFGDMVYSATVCELAIALAYSMLDEENPRAVAAQIIHAYHRRYPLTEAEQRALLPLVTARLSMSVCYSAHNRARNPDDPYQVVTEAAAWKLLEELDSWSTAGALAMIREACGMPAQTHRST